MRHTFSTFTLLCLTMLGMFSLMACSETVKQPNKEEIDYERPLPPGMSALRKVPQEEWPDLQTAFSQADPDFMLALQHSIDWFKKPSSQQFFPMDGITHTQAEQSVEAFRALMFTKDAVPNKIRRFADSFDVYMSVGYNLEGTVLFTGYYSPIFKASKTRSGPFQYPLYKAPAELKRDPKTGDVLGQFPSRLELEESGQLQGLELVYLPSELDAYIIHVNGAARLEMTDGSIMFVGFGGHNGHDYVSMRKEMLHDGKIGKRDGLPAMKAFFEKYPHELSTYINRNPRFIFFQEYEASAWPAGSLGVPVTTMRSLATDKSIFPRGGVILVDTQIPSIANPDLRRPFTQLMMDQDTGGAIRAPGRGDIFMGIGPGAEKKAGRQAEEGKLYYFFLKPEKVE